MLHSHALQNDGDHRRPIVLAGLESLLHISAHDLATLATLAAERQSPPHAPE